VTLKSAEISLVTLKSAEISTVTMKSHLWRWNLTCDNEVSLVTLKSAEISLVTMKSHLWHWNLTCETEISFVQCNFHFNCQWIQQEKFQGIILSSKSGFQKVRLPLHLSATMCGDQSHGYQPLTRGLVVSQMHKKFVCFRSEKKINYRKNKKVNDSQPPTVHLD
jgi:hypothetical protein